MTSIFENSLIISDIKIQIVIVIFIAKKHPFFHSPIRIKKARRNVSPDLTNGLYGHLGSVLMVLPALWALNWGAY